MNESHAPSRANIEHFNAVAQTWEENPERTALARAVAEAMIEALSLDATEYTLELGCGTGLVTGLLASSVGRVLAVDSSTGMLEVLRRKLDELAIDNVEPLEVDISQQVPAGPFDVVFSSMTLHHVGDVAGLIARVYDVLAPGGQIALADLVAEDGSFHSSDVAGVMHHGFAAAELTTWLEAAGFVDVKVRTIYQLTKTVEDGTSRDYPVQLATAQRPRSA